MRQPAKQSLFSQMLPNSHCSSSRQVTQASVSGSQYKPSPHAPGVTPLSSAQLSRHSLLAHLELTAMRRIDANHASPV